MPSIFGCKIYTEFETLNKEFKILNEKQQQQQQKNNEERCFILLDLFFLALSKKPYQILQKLLGICIMTFWNYH